MTIHHSPIAQVEVEDKITKLKTKIEEYENEYKRATGDDKKEILQMIIAKEGRLHDLSEKLKALQQQGNEQRTHPFTFILW
jgi:lipid II:glycine glycyltransferase (peptidoglycan interpeptide bridge formation enzyme)